MLVCFWWDIGMTGESSGTRHRRCKNTLKFTIFGVELKMPVGQWVSSWVLWNLCFTCQIKGLKFIQLERNLEKKSQKKWMDREVGRKIEDIFTEAKLIRGQKTSLTVLHSWKELETRPCGFCCLLTPSLYLATAILTINQRFQHMEKLFCFYSYLWESELIIFPSLN